MASIVTYQPFKGLYALLAVAFEAFRFPLWILLYISASGRPNPQWTFRQAIGMRVVKAFLGHTSAVRVRTPLSLSAGSEKNRFVVMKPAASNLYKGPLEDAKIKPTSIGGTWTPAPITAGSSNVDSAEVVMHFHGGGYVIGDGRDHDTGFAARTFLRHAGVSHVFTPQYRLSSNPGGRFPAALQDALTSYSHLIHTLRIPASRITISGDSAGGNLSLALLRYISEYGEQLSLPWPGCVWLWSPWVDVSTSLDTANMSQSPQYKTDYLAAAFGYWGGSTFTEHLNPHDPYISPLNNAFASKSPIWIQTGRSEVLYDDDVEIAKQFREIEGNKVDLVVKDNMPHDIILIGHILGFGKEAGECAKRAGEFFRSNRNSAHL